MTLRGNAALLDGKSERGEALQRGRETGPPVVRRHDDHKARVESTMSRRESGVVTSR